MTIHFTPALGETTRVPVPITNDGVVRLRFVASVDAREYDELERKGVQVQLWSDLPALGCGRSAGQWGEITFKREPGSAMRTSECHHDGEEGVAYIHPSLVSGDVTEAQSDDIVRLSFETDIQLAGPSTLDVVGTWQFSFTYRLVNGASGEVTWMGQFGNDGLLVLTSDPHHRLPGQQQRPTSPDEHGASEWLRLGRASKYTIASISKSGSLQFFTGPGEVRDAKVLLLVPRVDPGDILLNPALLLSASSPESGLYIRGDEYILSIRAPSGLHTIETSLDKLGFRHSVQKILMSCSPEALRLASQGQQTDAVILSSLKASTPAQVVLIPPPSVRTPAVSLTTRQLATLLPNGTERFMIFIPSYKVAGLYSLAGNVHTLKIATGPSGMESTISPVYPLSRSSKDSKEDEGLPLISFITPYTFASLEPAPEVLPTPPPSPKRTLGVCVSTSAESTIYPQDLHSIPPSTSRSSQFAESSSVSNGSDASSSSATSQSAIITSNSLWELIIGLLPMRPSGSMVAACMALFVHIAKMFIKTVFGIFLYLVLGPKLPQEKGKRNEAERITEKGRVDETSTLLGKSTRCLSPHEFTEKMYEGAKELPTIEEEDSTAVESFTPPVPPPRFAAPRLLYLCVDVPAGKTSFIVTTPHDISVISNGQSIKVNAEGIVACPDAAELRILSFGLDAPGRVKIFVI